MLRWISSLWLPQHSAGQEEVTTCCCFVWESCRLLQTARKHARLSLIFLLMVIRLQRWWWNLIEAGENWSWVLWLTFFECFISASCSGTRDPQRPRWSLNCSLHPLPLCDLLTPSGAHRISPISDHTRYISIAAPAQASGCVYTAQDACLYGVSLLKIVTPFLAAATCASAPCHYFTAPVI